MKEYPVNIGTSLPRFQTPKAEQKKTLEDLKAGRVDIVIGTHRLLSKDVEFKNLGLLVVDEEQRFGVTHKEKIKTNERECGCIDIDGHSDSANDAYESDRYSGYESAGGSTGGSSCRFRLM